MNNLGKFEKLKIKYDTGLLPPPFCHRYELSLKRDPDGLCVISLVLEYYDRDEISEEDILIEGFTGDDDFSWKGKLPEVWYTEVQNVIEHSNWVKHQKTNSYGSQLEIQHVSAGESQILYPADQSIWEILCQDLIQVTFELGEKEVPLKIEYLINEKGNTARFQMLFSFSAHKLIISDAGKKRKTVAWENAKELMKRIYAIDYDPEMGVEKVPKKPGYFISPGDGLWHDLSQSANNKKPQNEKLKKLNLMIQQYL